MKRDGIQLAPGLKVEPSQLCGAIGPATGKPCTRFANHAAVALAVPSQVVGADFHEARDLSNPDGLVRPLVERWPVAWPESIYADSTGDSVEREIAAADAQEVDDGAVPASAPADKEELDLVNEMLSAAGFVVADQFQRAGAPGSGVFYAELRQTQPVSAPVIVRVQMLFGRPIFWGVANAWITDLDSLREALR